MSVCAKTIGWKPKSTDENVASVRFRCLAPMRELARGGFDVELYSPARDAEGAYAAVIFSKLYGTQDQKIAASLSLRGVRTILDVSDNHFYNPLGLPEYVRAGADLRTMAEMVDRVVCCSTELADVMQQETSLSAPPIVVGDAVEDMQLPASCRDPFNVAPGEPFRIVWFGSHGSPNATAGMEDIARVAPQLAYANSVRSSELIIVSNSKEKFERLAPALPLPSRYAHWSESSLMSAFAFANLVVVPVSANPFTRCKSNNRVATALWHGIPVVADGVPAYADLGRFAVLDDWDRGFEDALAASSELRLRTKAGADFVHENFSIERIASDWRRAIEIVLLQPGRMRA